MPYLRILLWVAVAASAGCGYIGEPLPPLANIPARVTDLAAIQHGGRIQARFTIPQLTTEGFAIKQPLDLDLRIGVAPEPFQEDRWAAAARKLQPDSTANGKASYEIPAAEWTGKEIVLGVRTMAANGKESGWSKFLALPVAPAPHTPADVRAENTAGGVRLTWSAPGKDFRIFRQVGNGSPEAVADVPQAPWTDQSTRFGQHYTYQLKTIVKLGENREAESDFSQAVSITPQDQFPPAAPAGLRADAAPNSIELSWDRNVEPDWAQYRVYRAVAGGAFEKLAEVEVPAYSDTSVEHGKTYTYQVSAWDRAGNESGRSASAEVEFP